jgi:hypothetical protein
MSVANYWPHALEVMPARVGKAQRSGRGAKQGRANALLEKLESRARTIDGFTYDFDKFRWRILAYVNSSQGHNDLLFLAK